VKHYGHFSQIFDLKTSLPSPIEHVTNVKIMRPNACLGLISCCHNGINSGAGLGPVPRPGLSSRGIAAEVCTDGSVRGSGTRYLLPYRGHFGHSVYRTERLWCMYREPRGVGPSVHTSVQALYYVFMFS